MIVEHFYCLELCNVLPIITTEHQRTATFLTRRKLHLTERVPMKAYTIQVHELDHQIWGGVRFFQKTDQIY
jgi:hypothetical protein